MKPHSSGRKRPGHFEADELLHCAEQGFDIFAASLESAIAMLDVHGRILRWNRGAERLLGYKASEAVGSHISTLYARRDALAGKPNEDLRHAVRYGRFEDSGWLVRINAAPFLAHVVITAISDTEGNLIGFTNTIEDLTERVKADTASRERDEMLRLLIDSVKDYAIFILDPNGTVLTWNSGAERLKGYKAEEIIGTNFAKFYPEEDVKRRKPERELEIAARLGRFEDVGPRVRKDGSSFLANVVISAIRDDKGNLRGFSKLTRDLTETTQFQALQDTQTATFNILDDFADEKAKIEDTQRATFNILADFALEREKVETTQRATFNIMEDLGAEKDKLSREIVERQRAEADLEATNKELEAFSYSVSHDLRAPLRGIDGFSHLLLENYSKSLDERGATYLRFVRDASQEMSKLIDDLLNLSRMTRSEMHRERVNLSSLAASVLGGLGASQPERQVDMIITPGLEANCDARLLRIVLENLLGNAWKFTGKIERARIEFGVTDQDGTRAFFVRDNGAGFDMAYSKKLFGAFQRLHTAAEFPGTGIGLATVRRIIHRHGGTIWAEGSVEKGATFYFTLGA